MSNVESLGNILFFFSGKRNVLILDQLQPLERSRITKANEPSYRATERSKVFTV
jgi:hypothetical protein